jgi:hypothetical protein
MITVIIKRAKSELQNNVELLAKINRELKVNHIAEEICKEYDFDIDIIDGIPFEFVDDLDASAKTVDSAIQLNSSLIDEEFEVVMRYAIHELVHALQHMKLKGLESLEDLEYLDRGDELEAFQYQVEYESEERGQDVAEEYVENLIEYHEVPPDEREEKKKELLEKTQ